MSVFSHYRLIALLTAFLTLVPAAQGQEESASQPTDSQDQAAESVEERVEYWAGRILAPGRGAQEFLVTFRWDEAGEISADIDLPAQGIIDEPLADVGFGLRQISFTHEASGSEYVLERNEAGDGGRGTFVIGTDRADLQMKRVDAEAASKFRFERPQTPQPPYPYDSINVEFESMVDGAMISGTLTVPDGLGPFPAVILISGSGPQNRDNLLLGHRMFHVLADFLTRRDVIVFRYDDRGIGGSGGDLMQADYSILTGDVLTAVNMLLTNDQLSVSEIGLVGFDEGATIAASAAAESPDVAFMVAMAGPAQAGKDVIRRQVERGMKGANMPPSEIQRRMEKHDRVITLLEEGAGPDVVREALTDVIATQVNFDRSSGEPLPPQLEAAIDSELRQRTTPYFRSYLFTDPTEFYSKVTCPVLAIAGSSDRQLDPPAQHLTMIESAVNQAGGHPPFVMVLPMVNHIFQQSSSGSPSEYMMIEETIAPRALEVISNWVLDPEKLTPDQQNARMQQRAQEAKEEMPEDAEPAREPDDEG